ncbi:MAG: energy transducer TonB [Proteobacteria bacterium]|nr:energy transducer TonB [Pseudomonadota bacterium]
MNAVSGRLGLGFLALCVTEAACGQQMIEGPTPALACLVSSGPTVKPLVYPESAYQRKDAGTVSVRLSFDAPDAAPDYKLLSDHRTTSAELLDAVRSHVRQFRLPCLKAGEVPVVLFQDYVFVPNDGRKVVSTDPEQRTADGEKPYEAACVLNAASNPPTYPTRQMREDMWGPVLVDLQFASAGAAPEVKVLSSPHANFSSAVMAAAERLRLTCKTDAADAFPKTFSLIYKFRINDGPVTVLKDLDLVDFIRGSQDYPTPVYFDTAQMGCPFDLRVTYYRPYELNSVGQLEQTHPARKPLVDWLKRFTLRLPEKTRRMVIGDTLTVHVPCTTIDL